jgi:endonuclease G
VYSEKHEQAKWVAHIIPPDVVRGNEGRSNDFRIDPLIKTGSSVEEDYFIKTPKPNEAGKFDYKGFGFDRGHLAPSADFRWSQRALSESFFYSNMSPQRGEFNRDSWAKLEDMMRGYIYRNPTAYLYVITGGVLKDDLPKIPEAKNNVTIPEKYYKIVVDLEKKRAIAFLMPNKKADYPHESYATSIDEIEKLTGFDFFHQLDDQLESELEAQKDPKPFLSPTEQADIEPQDPTKLPKNTFNTVQAKLYADTGKKIAVRGTVVSTKMSSKGNIFINLDKQFPNQIFSISIFKDKVVNFSYLPHEFLMGKQIEVTGKISMFNGVPSMTIDSEKAIEVLQESE